jgi:hypothetical protein
MGCWISVPPRDANFVGRWVHADGEWVSFSPNGKFKYCDGENYYKGWVVDWHELGRGQWEFYTSKSLFCCDEEKSKLYSVNKGPEIVTEDVRFFFNSEFN